ncbi:MULTISPECIES: hypothetical protein [unclassified Prochlorococcus]|uniref:hypothetical protein n=1 Tax=unclassified Prochlorococcus TaxID=2627481 RepID=UPI0005338472|nr:MULTISPECIES: hypothetical protein [unclassified Prochlorococcus]KGG16540.1 hypothetical protein EV06_0381 [Prochlorococcus sp. MIT 0602]KGG16985.1 hypothetical protein EV07_0413 [Prochlorococcus sp. MIT 0603]
MDFKNQGLTVGELTITIAIVILAGFLWSNIVKKDASNQSLNRYSTTSNVLFNNPSLKV